MGSSFSSIEAEPHPRPLHNDADSKTASVIVVSWNGRHLLHECLDSLLAQTYRSLEVVVVDNGSTDGSAQFVRDTYLGAVSVVELEQNRGFAGGNNAGFRAASGRYLLLLNNDAVAAPEWAEALVRAAEADPTIGGCASKILLYSDPRRFENTGILLYPDGSARGRGRLQMDEGQFEALDEVACTSGCACLYRREAIEQVGGFDDAFFCYVDDVELGLKCRVAGWRFVYVPTAVALHKESATAGKYSLLKAFLVERNRIWAMLKTYPALRIIASPWFTTLRYANNALAAARGVGTAGGFARGENPAMLLWLVVRAHLAALAQLRRVLRERARLQRLRSPGPHPLRVWLGERALSAREFTHVS